MKAKFGMVVVAGSGKIGGHVASRNKAGAYFRTKVTPVNPQSSNQLSARSRLTSFSQSWRGLTENQRAAWNAAVGAFAKTDIFGDLKNPSGFNLYQRLNNNLAIGEETALTLPPIPSGVASETFDSLSFDVSSSTMEIGMSDDVPATSFVKIFATAPQSPGVSFVKSEYRMLGFVAPAQTTPVNFGPAYIGRFGAIAAGQKVFVKIVFVNATTGEEGTPQQLSTIAVA